MGLGLSGTAGLGLSGTDDSAYQEPKPELTPWNRLPILPYNYANNKESFGFLLTLACAVDARP